MLATAVPEPFTRPGWIFELKYDGFRVLITKQGQSVRLLSRSGRDMIASFPELLKELQALPDLTIDGELVVLDEHGGADFERLRRRSVMRLKKNIDHAAAQESAAVFAFDLLMLAGNDMRQLPLIERKKALARVLKRSARIKYLTHIEEQGEALFHKVAGLALEGIIGKLATSPYVAGRSLNWRKIKTPTGLARDDKRLRHLRK